MIQRQTRTLSIGKFALIIQTSVLEQETPGEWNLKKVHNIHQMCMLHGAAIFFENVSHCLISPGPVNTKHLYNIRTMLDQRR